MSAALRILATVTAVVCTGLALTSAGSGAPTASRDVAFGIADDAWLAHGAGTLESRLDELSKLGPEVVRFTVRWDRVATRRPQDARDPTDGAYQWAEVDGVLRGLRRHGIDPVVTLFGTPSWANGGRGPNWAPTSSRSFASFAYAAGRRYPWIKYWTIWNEPNRPTFLRPTTAKTYVETLLNPAYAELHAAIGRVQVGGGVSAPRAGDGGGVAPVAWIRGMAAARAKLDAYAHHPYPGRPQFETPWGPKCVNCQTITMADLERLEREVHRAFGRKPIWLTEYGYQTNPPELFLGVTPEQQATFVSTAALRVYRSSSVTMLVFFMVRDDPSAAGWQSGLFTAGGLVKPAYASFRSPLVQIARHGGRVTLWGQIRPRSGRQPFRVRLEEDDGASWVGGTHWTDANGFFSITVTAPAGAHLRIWSPRDSAYGHEILVR
jgi:Glycosyl hydrolase catalytic core